MLDQTMLDRYLDDVDSYLHVDRVHRERVLAEIEGHLHDAVEAHIADGVAPQEAMQRAINDVGPPQDVAMQFAPTPAPARSVRGWRRWAPMALPAVMLAVGASLLVWDLLLVRNGLTDGLKVVLRRSLLYAAGAGALTVATYVTIRNGDRDPTWRRAAWALAGLTGIVVALNVTS